MRSSAKGRNLGLPPGLAIVAKQKERDMTLQEQVEQFERQARRADDNAKAELLANCSKGYCQVK